MVKTLAPTPENLSKRLMKESDSSIDSTNFVETFQPTPVMFPTAVRSLAPTNAPHEEREVKKSSSRRSLRAAFDKSSVNNNIII